MVSSIISPWAPEVSCFQPPNGPKPNLSPSFLSSFITATSLPMNLLDRKCTLWLGNFFSQALLISLLAAGNHSTMSILRRFPSGSLPRQHAMIVLKLFKMRMVTLLPTLALYLPRAWVLKRKTRSWLSMYLPNFCLVM